MKPLSLSRYDGLIDKVNTAINPFSENLWQNLS